MEKEIEKCPGCENIKNLSFPFMTEERNGRDVFLMDTEGQGVGQENEYYLLIFYCPVCGKKLSTEKD